MNPEQVLSMPMVPDLTAAEPQSNISDPRQQLWNQFRSHSQMLFKKILDL